MYKSKYLVAGVALIVVLTAYFLINKPEEVLPALNSDSAEVDKRTTDETKNNRLVESDSLASEKIEETTHISLLENSIQNEKTLPLEKSENHELTPSKVVINTYIEERIWTFIDEQLALHPYAAVDKIECKEDSCILDLVAYDDGTNLIQSIIKNYSEKFDDKVDLLNLEHSEQGLNFKIEIANKED